MTISLFGVTKFVKFLFNSGFDVVESGNGSSERNHPFIIINVEIDDLVEETDRLCEILEEMGIDLEPITEPSPNIQASFDPVTGLGFIDLSYVDDSMLPKTEPLN